MCIIVDGTAVKIFGLKPLVVVEITKHCYRSNVYCDTLYS